MSDFQFTYHAFSHPNHPSPKVVNEDAMLAVSAVCQGRVSQGGQINAEERLLFAVSDGVHTAPHAARASRTLLRCLEQIWKADPELPPGKKLRKLQDDYTASAASHPERIGMSCTLVAAELRGPRASIYHVGDSRAWHIRDGQAKCLTRDHTHLETLIRAGEIPRDKAHQYESIYGALERCFVAAGDEERPDYDHCQFTLVDGDILLLVSDGLSALSDTSIEPLTHNEPRTSAEALFNAAAEAGSNDNITLILIFVTSTAL